MPLSVGDLSCGLSGLGECRADQVVTIAEFDAVSTWRLDGCATEYVPGGAQHPPAGLDRLAGLVDRPVTGLGNGGAATGLPTRWTQVFRLDTFTRMNVALIIL